jgi:uncharacterized Ntn-hydrolase superfamily protein
LTTARLIAAALVALALVASARAGEPADRAAVRPVATYSIVARDAETGQLGVAVQSHWFAVGTVVGWARSGVGAVATQSLARVSYGPLGLGLMAGGHSAPEALAALVEADDAPAVRQVAMVDARGEAAVHTGARCIAEASHVRGVAPDGSVYTCQANLMERPGVPEAMARAFEGTGGDLAERLVAALGAAEDAGGDIRGKQSAALLVVAGGPPTTTPWSERLFDLRVDDHPTPIAELRRLLRVSRAYNHMNEGDRALEAGDVAASLAHYAAAERLAGSNPEPVFWTAVALINAGRTEDALPRLERVFAADERWRETLGRLPEAGLISIDPGLLAELTRPRATHDRTTTPEAQDLDTP